jgi:hypothetical protein
LHASTYVDEQLYACTCEQCARLRCLGNELLNDLCFTAESDYGRAEIQREMLIGKQWAILAVPFVLRWA